MDRWTEPRLAALALALWVPLFFLTPAGLYTVDEVVQAASIIAMVETGGLVVANGYEAYGSEDLLLLYLVAGPHGPVAQYPAGFTYLAAPLFALGGLKAVFALNLVGALACLALSWGIARALGGLAVARLSVLVLLCASYLAPYAAAVWPHALALAFALGGMLCAVRCGLSDRVRPVLAILGGLSIGAGLMIRLDVLLILPPIAAWIVVFARYAYAHLALAGVGLVPFLAVSALVNQARFGLLTPFSYGNLEAGGTNLTSHVPVLAGLAAGGMLLLVIRHGPRLAPWLVGATAIAAAAATMAVPQVAGALWTLLQGIWVLVGDLTRHPGIGVMPGLMRDEEGLVTYFNIAKKALLQSLPWLAILPLALLRWRDRMPLLALAAFTLVAVVLPFAPRFWHGGYGPNMRYFLAAVPVLAIVAALALETLGQRSRGGSLIRNTLVLTLVGCVAVEGLAPVWSDHLLAHRLPLLLAALTLASTLIAMALGRNGTVPRWVWVPVLAPFALAAYSAYGLDVRQTLGVRAYGAAVAERYRRTLEPGTLVYDNFTQGLASLAGDDGVLIAVSATRSDDVDPALLRGALDDGLAVAVRQPDLEARVLAALDGEALVQDRVGPEGDEGILILRRP